MSYKNYAFDTISTVGGASIVLTSSQGSLFGGFFLNGSAGGTTLSLAVGGVTIFSTSANTNVLIAISNVGPIHAATGTFSCSGTGFYTVFVAR